MDFAMDLMITVAAPTISKYMFSRANMAHIIQIGVSNPECSPTVKWTLFSVVK